MPDFAGSRRVFLKDSCLSLLSLRWLLPTVLLPIASFISGCDAMEESRNSDEVQTVAEDFLDARNERELANTLTDGAAKNVHYLLESLQSQPDHGESWHTASIDEPTFRGEYWAAAPIQLANRAETDSRYLNILARRVGSGWRVYGIEIVSSPEEKSVIDFEDTLSVLQFAVALSFARLIEDAQKQAESSTFPVSSPTPNDSSTTFTDL